MCGELGDSCGGHVPRHLPERLSQRTTDPRHVYSFVFHRTHHVYGGKIAIACQLNVPYVKCLYNIYPHLPIHPSLT